MQLDVLRELEPLVAANLNRHLSVAKDWMPHEYVPWSDGRDFVKDPWRLDDSRLTHEGRVALEMNLLTEDNLPGYHYTIATEFGRDGAWGTWVNRWTAEEGRHAQCLRDYLLVTRAVDPDQLERDRMKAVQVGFDGTWAPPLEVLAYVAFQELATRVAHRNTGRYLNDPIAERLLSRISTDENLHMVFYRSLVSGALEVAPSETVRSICGRMARFEMPGRYVPGYRKRAMTMARAGIFTVRIYVEDVVMPLLRHWGFFDLEGLSGEADRARQELATQLEQLLQAAARQEERYQAMAALAQH